MVGVQNNSNFFFVLLILQGIPPRQKLFLCDLFLMSHFDEEYIFSFLLTILSDQYDLYLPIYISFLIFIIITKIVIDLLLTISLS